MGHALLFMLMAVGIKVLCIVLHAAKVLCVIGESDIVSVLFLWKCRTWSYPTAISVSRLCKGAFFSGAQQKNVAGMSNVRCGIEKQTCSNDPCFRLIFAGGYPECGVRWVDNSCQCGVYAERRMLWRGWKKIPFCSVYALLQLSRMKTKTMGSRTEKERCTE